MSATLTPYGRALLLNAVFRHDVYVAPTGIWLAYTRAIPVAGSDGTQLDEPTGLVRTALPALTSAGWGLTAGFSEVYNMTAITPAAASADCGLLQGWAVVNTATIAQGDCVAVGELVLPFQLDAGESPPPIDIGGLAFGLYD